MASLMCVNGTMGWGWRRERPARECAARSAGGGGWWGQGLARSSPPSGEDGMCARESNPGHLVLLRPPKIPPLRPAPAGGGV